jgi:hypothetical protein
MTMLFIGAKGRFADMFTQVRPLLEDCQALPEL